MPTPDFGHGRWIKSSFSSPSTNCVELAAVDGWIGLRDSKLDDRSPILTFTPAELRAFLDGAKNQDFDHLAPGSDRRRRGAREW